VYLACKNSCSSNP